MVGSGLYVLAGAVTRDIAGPSIVISYALAAIAAILSALCYAGAVSMQAVQFAVVVKWLQLRGLPSKIRLVFFFLVGLGVSVRNVQSEAGRMGFIPK